MGRELLDAAEIAERAGAIDPSWSVSSEALSRKVEFPTFLTAVEFVSRMAPVAESLDHHPDLRLSWRTVELSLSTHSAGGVTELDFRLAGELDRVIRDLTR